MTSDQGDYELVGSVSGEDGKGNAFEPFTSASGATRLSSIWFTASRSAILPFSCYARLAAVPVNPSLSVTVSVTVKTPSTA